jgi:hypothetical protein
LVQGYLLVPSPSSSWLEGQNRHNLAVVRGRTAIDRLLAVTAVAELLVMVDDPEDFIWGSAHKGGNRRSTVKGRGRALRPTLGLWKHSSDVLRLGSAHRDWLARPGRRVISTLVCAFVRLAGDAIRKGN